MSPAELTKVRTVRAHATPARRADIRWTPDSDGENLIRMTTPRPSRRGGPCIPGSVLGPVVLLAVAAAGLAGCGRGSAEGDGPGGRVPAVEAVQAREGALPLTQRLSGVVRARNQVGIYPQITAVVTDVLVQNGEIVRAGQPLVRLRDTEFRERLKQAQASHRIAVAELRKAEAQAKEARADLARMQSLAENDLASGAELETVEARAEGAEAEVALAEARVDQALAEAQEQEENLTQTVVRAPVAGHVGDRDAEVGMLAGPGGRLFTVGKLDSVRVQVVLTDRMLAYIEEGQRTEIAASGVATSARLSRISPFLHPVTHTTEAEIDLANPGAALKPGMFVTVEVFHGESERATLVPLAAVYESPVTGLTGVWVTDAAIEQEPVEVVDAAAPAAFTEPIAFSFLPTEVLAQGRMEAAVRGVAPGAWVVTLGQDLLSGEKAPARVRPVKWARVERLQQLQREDMMEELLERKAPLP